MYTAYPVSIAEIRKVHVSHADYWEVVGSESKLIRVLTNRNFSIGERVAIHIDPLNNPVHSCAPLYRYITEITQAVPLFSDDDSLLIRLSLYNTVEL